MITPDLHGHAERDGFVLANGHELWRLNPCNTRHDMGNPLFNGSRPVWLPPRSDRHHNADRPALPYELGSPLEEKTVTFPRSESI